MIVIDRDRPHLTPAFDPWSAIVYSARGTDVRTVMVDGKVLLDGFLPTGFDPAEVVASARLAATMLAGRVGL
jgi:5-methylthioadenosine/S-adenosylhomocysteine deaminase